MDQRQRPAAPREAARITQMLDQVLGIDRFDRQPVAVKELMLEYSRVTAPEQPIVEVLEKDLEGCAGALVPSESLPRRWGVLYQRGQSVGRRNYTLGHEFGHWVLHRGLLEQAVYCTEADVFRKSGNDIEREADEFAANLLMPLHDFRRQLGPKDHPDLAALRAMADRYGVSLTAAIMRWLEYTETRAIMLVSVDGYGDWSKSSKAAFKSRRYIRTKSEPFELPGQSIAARQDFEADESATGILQPSGVWFDEPVVEMCIRADRWDREITILHFDGPEPIDQGEEPVEDVFDRFNQQ